MAYLTDVRLHHLIGETALQVVVFLFLHAFPRLHRNQRRNGKLGVALRRAGRVCIVQADSGDVVIGLCQVGVVGPDLVGVHGLAGEGGVVINTVLFRRALEDHHHGNRRHCQPAAVDHLDGTYRHLAQRLDHLGIHLVGIRAGNHIVAIDHVTASGAYARHLAVFDKDFFHFLVKLILGAVFFALCLQLHAHLMGEAAADVRAGEVVCHQEGIDGKGQVIHSVAHINPVGGEHLHNLLRKMIS